MRRKILFLCSLIAVCIVAFTACTTDSVVEALENSWYGRDTEEEEANTVALEVVSTFAGNDGNALDYRNACQQWAKKSGVTLVDMSSISDETFKTRVITDFETGSEPDVLFFFNGADANNFIQAGKVVSLGEIREQYPDFASNLDEKMIPGSLVDGKIYAIPVNGYWEALFVNRTVLKAAGVEMPGADYQWEEFLRDCEKIKQAGYVPIAASLGNIPHYWWEYAIFNHTTTWNHQTIPESVEEPIGQMWVEGMEDIKQLYKNGYFPINTNSATDEQIFSMFTNDKAAFLLDGSWRVGSIVYACRKYLNNPDILDEERLDQFDVTFVPTKGNRETTDLIGGVSMGYYITRKAWEDPEKREAAVSFVSYMTSDEIATKFVQHTASVLKVQPKVNEEDYNSLQIKAMKMLEQSTSLTGAVQDLFQGECREPTFDGMPDIVTGKVSARDAVEKGLRIYNAGR